MSAVLAALMSWPHAMTGQSSQGPLSPGALANNTASCPFAYSSGLNLAPSGNAASSNNSYASASHCDCCDANTSCLMATNFGFSIPGGATITGIQVEIEKRRSVAAGGIIEDNGLRLIKAGSVVGADRAAFGINWPTTDAYSSYGSSADLWGSTWTPAEINAGNFGVAFACISYTCGATMSSFVDHIRITVFYNSSLDIGISNFSGEIDNKLFKLFWVNESLNYFQLLKIERSSDGQNWEEAGQAPAGAGLFRDLDSRPGRWAYRLRSADGQGQEATEVLWLENPVEGPLFTFLNEKGGTAHIQWLGASGTYRLLHLQGQVLAQGHWSQPGEELLIPLSPWAGTPLLIECVSEGRIERRLLNTLPVW